MRTETINLPAERSSPAAARRFVRSLVDPSVTDPGDLLLCVSELVSNAVLHAGTACRLRMSVDGAWMRVEVRDANPGVLPAKRAYQQSAVTGRGLRIVELLSDRWGVDVDEGGKTVWFETDGMRAGAGPMTDLVEVELLELPLDVHRRASEQTDALRREFLLIAAGGDQSHVPARLTTVMEQLSGRYAGFTGAPDAELQAALERGDTSIDLTYHVPPDVAEAAARLGGLLDEADEYCRAGEHLITLARTPEAVAYTRWFLEQFIVQSQGAPPTPWGASKQAGDARGRGDPVVVEHGGGAAATVRLPPEVDLDQAPALRQAIADLSGREINDITVDGSGVEFIDSVGLSVLMAAYSRCKDAGGDLRISPASRQLRSTLDLAGLSDLLMG